MEFNQIVKWILVALILAAIGYLIYLIIQGQNQNGESFINEVSPATYKSFDPDVPVPTQVVTSMNAKNLLDAGIIKKFKGLDGVFDYTLKFNLPTPNGGAYNTNNHYYQIYMGIDKTNLQPICKLQRQGDNWYSHTFKSSQEFKYAEIRLEDGSGNAVVMASGNF
jgi:hypothetical protein